MYIYNGLQSAVSNGAVFASRADYCADKAAAFDTQIQQMVVYGDPTVSSGMNTVTITPSTFPRAITVAIKDYTANALFSTFKFTNKPAVTMMYLGNYQPTGAGC